MSKAGSYTLCSRNARLQKALVRRAQWRTTGGRPWGKGNEQAWKDELTAVCCGTCVPTHPVLRRQRSSPSVLEGRNETVTHGSSGRNLLRRLHPTVRQDKHEEQNGEGEKAEEHDEQQG